MKKIIYFIFTLLLLAVFTSASNTVTSDSRIGNAAPNFTIGNDEEVVKLDQFRGKNVIVNVWSSADAKSRLENMRLNRLAGNSDKLVQVAVNMDRSRALFNEVITADSLNAAGQYYCEVQDRPSFKKKWGVDENYCSFLINAKGVVVAVNPSAKQLRQALK